MVLLVAVAACGDDDEAGADTTAPMTATTGTDTEGEGDTASAGGTVTIGAETWTFVPDIQCSVWPDNTVNIAGSAAEDPSTEIVFDRFDDGSVELRVSGSDFDWTTSGNSDVDVSVEGESVSGTAMMSLMQGGETAEASFAFQC